MELSCTASLPANCLAACRSEGRAGARQYAGVYLQLTGGEVEAGMREHWNCPNWLPAWLARTAGAGNTAATVLL